MKLCIIIIAFFYFSTILTGAFSIQADRNNDQYIEQKLLRQKRDLIGWNRAQNTVNQYKRRKTAGDDSLPYVEQFKKFMMKLNSKKKQEIKKALDTIRKRQNSRH